jgi:hypothetical protein
MGKLVSAHQEGHYLSLEKEKNALGVVILE